MPVSRVGRKRYVIAFAFSDAVIRSVERTVLNDKIKCSGDRPECSRCKSLSKLCIYAKTQRRRNTKTGVSQKHNKAAELLSKSQHGETVSSPTVPAIVPALADVDVDVDVDVTSDPMGTAWPNPLYQLDYLDTSSDLTMPVDTWFSNEHTFQSDTVSFLAPWLPMPEADQPLPLVTTSSPLGTRS